MRGKLEVNIIPAGEASWRSKRLARRASVTSHFFLFLYAFSAPHSIAVAQASVLLSIVAWGVERFCRRETGVRMYSIPGGAALATFFILCLISGILSYEPRISLDGMRSVFFMAATIFVAGRIGSLRQAVILALALIFSAQANVLYTFYQKACGVGFRITKLSEGSPLREFLREGDVILTIDGKRGQDLQRLSAAALLNTQTPISIKARRLESYFTCEIPRASLAKSLQGTDAGLGVEIAPARDFRAMGFFNHYVTYAEVMQILISLALGMWLATPCGSYLRRALGAALVAMFLALLFTLTRAPLLGLGASVAVILAAAWRRGQVKGKIALLALLAAVSVSAVAIGYAYASRKMGVGDMQEGSLFWRFVVWQEGMQLVERHPIFGIGRNSDKIHGTEWGLYAQGDLPPGHFHNSYLQIAVWYGIPALLAYAWLLRDYFGALGKVSLSGFACLNEVDEIGIGIGVGTFGALFGFAVSSLVHFNLGDGEVAITLWLTLGIALAVWKRFFDQETVKA